MTTISVNMVAAMRVLAALERHLSSLTDAERDALKAEARGPVQGVLDIINDSGASNEVVAVLALSLLVSVDERAQAEADTVPIDMRCTHGVSVDRRCFDCDPPTGDLEGGP